MIIDIVKIVSELKLQNITVKKDTPSERNTVKLSSAVSYYADSSYHIINIEAWGSLAEYIADNFKKGDYMNITGELLRQDWQSPAGEKKISYVIKITSAKKLPGTSSGSAQDKASSDLPPADDESLPFN